SPFSSVSQLCGPMFHQPSLAQPLVSLYPSATPTRASVLLQSLRSARAGTVPRAMHIAARPTANTRLLMPISSSLHDGCGVKIPCCYPCSSGNVPHCSRIIRHLPASRLDPVPQPLQRNTGCGADGEATNPLSSDTVWPPPPWLIIFNVMLK